MSNENLPELKPEVQSILNAIKGKASFDEATNTVVFDNDTFESTLPEGLTKKEFKQVETHKQHFAAAQALVTGELATEAMGKNKDLKDVSSTVQYPCGKSVTLVKREVTMKASPTSDEMVTKYGVVSSRLVTKVPGSLITNVRSRVAAMAVAQGLNK